MLIYFYYIHNLLCLQNVIILHYQRVNNTSIYESTFIAIDDFFHYYILPCIAMLHGVDALTRTDFMELMR